ncbi:hypothetical protein ACIBRY_33620 [Streptomyces anulatus]
MTSAIADSSRSIAPSTDVSASKSSWGIPPPELAEAAQHAAEAAYGIGAADSPAALQEARE